MAVGIGIWDEIDEVDEDFGHLPTYGVECGLAWVNALCSPL